MIGALWWLLENWLLLVYAGGVAVAYVVGGWRLALGVATLGAGVLLYRQGAKDADERHKDWMQERARRQDDAYREIDERGASRDDVADRLHNGRF